MILIRHDSIFKSPAKVLVNPVNCVGRMGKGLALEFKERYPRYYLRYVETCNQGELDYGRLFIYQHNVNEEDGRIIVSLPTKIHWRDSSDLAGVRKGLSKLCLLMTRHFPGESLALPAVGCGEGGLQWPDVRAVIADVFKDLPSFVYIHLPTD